MSVNVLNYRHALSALICSIALVLQGCSERESLAGYVEEGTASYYADSFEGKITASGELMKQDGYTAAHNSLPFGTVIRVTNLVNKRSVELRINDRGPKVDGRILDVTKRAAGVLDFTRSGLARVRIEVLE